MKGQALMWCSEEGAAACRAADPEAMECRQLAVEGAVVIAVSVPDSMLMSDEPFSLLEGALRRVYPNCTLVAVPEQGGIETLDRAEMARAGWSHKEAVERLTAQRDAAERALLKAGG